MTTTVIRLTEVIRRVRGTRQERRCLLLGLKRRILLEDHTGQRHPLHLLEVVHERYFVLVAPEHAEQLQALQEAHAGIDDALTILIAHVHVLSMRDHRFIDRAGVPDILRHSTHYILRQVALRLAPGLPEAPEQHGVIDAHEFLEESLRRKTW